MTGVQASSAMRSTVLSQCILLDSLALNSFFATFANLCESLFPFLEEEAWKHLAQAPYTRNIRIR